jgi:hypothetical protein
LNYMHKYSEARIFELSSSQDLKAKQTACDHSASSDANGLMGDTGEGALHREERK